MEYSGLILAGPQVELLHRPIISGVDSSFVTSGLTAALVYLTLVRFCPAWLADPVSKPTSPRQGEQSR